MGCGSSSSKGKKAARKNSVKPVDDEIKQDSEEAQKKEVKKKEKKDAQEKAEMTEEKKKEEEGEKIQLKPQKSSVDIQKVALTDGIVQDYVNLEKAVHRLEHKNVIKKYEEKTIAADEIKKTLDQLEATYKELKKQTEKEKADVANIEQPSVRSFLKQQGTWNDRLSKEQQEYEEAVNKENVAEKEMTVAKKQYDRASRIAEIYKQQCDKLADLYDQQDRMLTTVFGTDCASEKESKLESEVNDLAEWQQRVSLAKFKWTNGRVLLVHARTQMAFGISRWKELEHVDSANMRMRYFTAAEARNNFIAAGQNVQSCRVYLGKVKFPYCTEEEMAVMDSVLQESFSDIQTDATLKKALGVYKDTHKKLASLIQWFDKVIHETILKDLDKVTTEVTKRQRDLREERLRLMKKKVKEELGRKLEVVYDDETEDEFDREIAAIESNKLDDLDTTDKGLKEILNLSQPDGRNPSPMQLSMLAPIPDKDALFGDVKQKLNEYDNRRKALERRNQLEREKQELAIKEKLQMRAQNGQTVRKHRRFSTASLAETKENKPRKAPKPV